MEKIKNLLQGCSKEGKYRILMVVLFFVFTVQIGFLIYMNLFASDKILNFDGANAMIHGVEIWKTKSLRVPGWHDTTQLEFDMAACIAGPLYGLTHNIFLSYGIANILFAALYVYVILDIFKKLKKPLFHALIGLILVFTPYCIGMIDYYSMMFFQAAFYNIRVLIPLMLLDLLITKKEELKRPRNLVLLAVLCLFTFISSISCGIYVPLSGLAPIFVIFVLEIVLDEGLKRFDKLHLLVMAAVLVSAALGYLATKFLGYGGMGDSMGLTNYQNMSSNLDAVLLSFFMVLDAIPSASTTVLSAAGIVYLSKAFVVICLGVVFFLHIRALFKKEEGIPIGKFIAFILLWNVFEFIFCETRYSLSNPIIENRYYLIPVIPLMLLLAMEIENWSLAANHTMELLVNLGVTAFLIVLALGCDYYVVKKFDADAGYIKDIVNYVNETIPEVDSVILLHEPDTQGIYRLLDEDHKYTAYDPEKGRLVVYDYYDDYIKDLGESNLVLIYQWEALTDLLPEEYAADYEKIGEVDWFHVYYSESNRLPYE